MKIVFAAALANTAIIIIANIVHYKPAEPWQFIGFGIAMAAMMGAFYLIQPPCSSTSTNTEPKPSPTASSSPNKE